MPRVTDGEETTDNRDKGTELTGLAFVWARKASRGRPGAAQGRYRAGGFREG